MTRHLRIDDLTAITVPEQPALSPDGSQVAYVLRTVDAEGDRTCRALWKVGAHEGEPRQLTRSIADSSPAWSPDGTSIAFVRAQDGPGQLWLLPVDGGEPEQLTHLALGAGAPVWSPDGTSIAFTAPVDLHAAAGEDGPGGDAARAKRRGAPIVTDRLDYQADGAGLLRTMRRHLHVIDLASRSCRQVTEGDWHAGDPAWSPDGRRLAFGAATASDADLKMRAPVHVLDVTDPKATPQPVGLADGMAASVTWLAGPADGALLVAGIIDGPVGHTRLLRVPLDGGAVTDLTQPLDRNVMVGGPGYPGGLPHLYGNDSGGQQVLFCARDRGCTHLYDVPAGGGEVRTVLGGPGRVVAGLSVAGGTAAVVLATPTSFGEIAVVDLQSGIETVRTGHGETLAEADLYERTEREFTISDGTVVHGWLMRDRQRTGPLPLLLDIHGGPHNAWNGAADEAHLYHQELVANGWAVLLLNPRGSDGYGEDFFTAVIAGWGTSDAKDFLEPVDELVAEGTADPERLAVCGYSYGGFMTCYLTSRDSRFAAAVTGGVVADLTSMAGTSDAGHFLSEHELGGQPWSNGGSFAEMSPLQRVSEVSTPTLIVQGTADMRCPMGQAQQWHTALREQGVPTRLVLYPDASHLFILTGKPSHRLDWNHRTSEWVQRYAAGDAGSLAGPRSERIDAEHWQRRLSKLCVRHEVPGALLGILRLGTAPGGGDEVIEAVHGVLNVDTGVSATTDSLFQIGSISKVWTATLVMQLVDEGTLDLDAPLAEVLPDLALADPGVAAAVTMRHLLTHTSGIDGDVFTDTGRGDDCLERYVAQLDKAAQNHPLGATWSYCNSGFVLAGRVVEKITGMTWDAALANRITGPLGLDHTVTLPEQALMHRAAVGHIDADGKTTLAPVWGLPRSMGPAGLITSTPADVLGFARMHLTGGLAPDGTRVLSDASAAAMAEHQADLPDKYSLGDSWGLGWIRFDWGGHQLIGHDGNTIGQAAFLRLLPEQGLAVTLLTNGGHARDLYQDLYREIFAEIAGVTMAEPLTPPAEPPVVDIAPHVGVYERAGARIEVLSRDDGPALRTTVTGPLAALVPDPVEELTLVPVSQDLYVVRAPGQQTWTPVTFYALPTGQRYLHFGVRATPKVG